VRPRIPAELRLPRACQGVSGNLTSLSLPALTHVGPGNAGAVVFGQEPLLPLCRAQALVKQLQGAGWTGGAGYTCTYPSQPCP
jgi:hypothetical protein